MAVIALYSVIALGLIGAAVGLIFVTGETPVATLPPTPFPSTRQTVDLSELSPREAADRLFNRVVMASEQGNMQEAQQFAPMAIQAYERVARLDADAHYHMGLIYEVAGNFNNVRNQIAIIMQNTPDHLLGLTLQYRIAERSGDLVAAAKASAAFAAAYDAEILAGRPEYEAHRNTIEAFRREQTAAGGGQ